MEKLLSSGFNYKLRKVRKILLKENCVGASKYFLILEPYITYCKRIRQSAYAMYPTLAVTHADCFPVTVIHRCVWERHPCHGIGDNDITLLSFCQCYGKKEHYIYRHPLQHALFIKDFQES